MPIDLSGLITAADKLASARQAKRNEITQACNVAIDSGFEHNGRPYDSDSRSRQNITGLATALTAGVPLPEGFTWRDAGNNDVPMGPQDVIALGAAAIQHVQACYATSWDLKAQLDRKHSINGIREIKWPQ